MSTQEQPQKKQPKTDTNIVTDLKELSRSKSIRTVNFLGKKVEVRKLTLAECMDIQRMAKDTDENNPDQGFQLIRHTIKLGVPAAADFDDSDFEDFPFDDLNNLSTEVLKMAGMQPGK
jgi:hypothetical protein